jgi:2-polyprenyl-3-methyl-5-hydroxy-6-metoxy-1,4-benzoquinol methylase
MEKQHYDFELNLEATANVHRIEIEMISEGALVLDVGCHTGIIGEVLQQKKHAKVIGIDNDAEALDIARERLESAFVLDLEQPGWSNRLINEGFDHFDTILFGDVLEHTARPERILTEAKKLLKTKGQIIVSVPNVAHWRVRFGLLFGKFHYTESGILDKTHVRFFTKKTSREFIESCGYRIIRSDVAGYALPHWLLRLSPGLLAVQFVICAEPF